MKIPFTGEPGSWVMFAIAYVTGIAKSDSLNIVHLMVLLSLSLFLMAKSPVATFLRRRDRTVLPYVIIYLGAGIVGCVYSIVVQPSLSFLYATGVPLIILYFVLAGKGFSVLSEAAGMAMMGLSATIAASIGGEISSKLHLFWLFFLFYFASSFRVRFTIARYRVMSGLYSGFLVLIGAATAYMGIWTFLVFIPLVEDIFSALTARREEFRTLGIIETVKSVIFAGLIIAIVR